MRPVRLKGPLRGVVGGRKLRDHVGPAIVQKCSEETPINTIIFESLINANKILVAVAEATGIEYSGVNHRSCARQIACRGRSASTRENVVCGLRYATDRRARRLVGIQDFGSKGARKVGLGKSCKLCIGKREYLVARGR